MKFASCIVETRQFPDLVNVIQKHIEHLPDDIELFIVHANDNVHTLRNAFPNASLIKVSGIDTTEQYNQLLTDRVFWGSFQHFDRVGHI